MFVAYMFWRIRAIDENDARKILRLLQPKRESVAHTQKETTFFLELVRELQDAISAGHEQVARYYIMATADGKEFADSYRKALKNQKKRPDLDLDGLEAVLGLGVNDYRSLWTPIRYAANTAHWTHGGWVKLGDEHYFNLRCASLFLIGRWAKHLSALLSAERSIDVLVLQRDLRESSDIMNPAHWPNLPIRSAMPNSPKGWQAMSEAYCVCFENKGYQHMLKSWSPVGKELLASALNVENKTSSSEGIEPLREKSTSPLSDCGAESDEDIVLDVFKIIDKPISGEAHSEPSAAGAEEDKHSNSDFSDPDNSQEMISCPRVKQSSKSSTETKARDHISITDSNDEPDTTDDEQNSLRKPLEDHVELQMVELLGPDVANPCPNTPLQRNSSKVTTEPAVPLSSMMYLGPSVPIEHTDMPDRLSVIEDCEAIQQSMDKRAAAISAILLSGGTDDINYRTVESDRIARMGVLGLSAYSIWRARQRQAQLDCALKELSDLQKWTEHLIGLQETQGKGILETQMYLNKMKAELRQGGRLLSEARTATILEASARSSQIPDFPTKASVQSGAYYNANNQLGPPGPGLGSGYPGRSDYPSSGFQHPHPTGVGYRLPPNYYSNGQQFYPGHASYGMGFPSPMRHGMPPLSGAASYGSDLRSTNSGSNAPNSESGPASASHNMYNSVYSQGYQVGPGYHGAFQNSDYNNRYQNENYHSSVYNRTGSSGFAGPEASNRGETSNRRRREAAFSAGEDEEPPSKLQRLQPPSTLLESPGLSSATSDAPTSLGSVAITEEKVRGVRGSSAPTPSGTEAELRAQINNERILKPSAAAVGE